MPLNEIASNFVHPVLKRSVANLLKGLDDSKKVARYYNLKLTGNE